MMEIINYDLIVIGAGLSGSVIARKFADDGCKVLILESKDKVSGHIFDEKNEIGVLVQRYGPHIFHTNKENVYKFITSYHTWEDYKLKCEVYMEGKYTPSPFNFQTIDDYYTYEEAQEIKTQLSSEFPHSTKVTILELLNSSNTIIKKYAEFLYEKDYKLYTSKQWGLDPSKIDKSVLRRVPVRLDYKDAYFDDKYQILPQGGYHSFIRSLLNHKNIHLELNVNGFKFLTFDYKNYIIYHENTIVTCPVVYTGAIDHLMNFKFGELPYRSLRFVYKIINNESFQNSAVTAYPQAEGYTRITEYTKLPYQRIEGKTTVAYEYPIQAGSEKNADPYYPIPNDENHILYNMYLNESRKFNNLYLCGRLADYKYYNMDETIDNALKVYDKLRREK